MRHGLRFEAMNKQSFTLPELGWSAFFLSQLSLEELEETTPVRVTEVHKNAFVTVAEPGVAQFPMTSDLIEHGVAVGDWILIENATATPLRVLDRRSVLNRRGAGDFPSAQLIAANIDTLFVVSSCNADFNLARLERFRALALQARVESVLVLTKSDLCADPAKYAELARGNFKDWAIELIDATSDEATAQLLPWCGEGQTVALLGSSGVGKSTITNALTGAGLQTQDIREDDAKGRHTTTGRSMHKIRSGGWLLDTPGIRALRLMDVSDGLDAVFQDLVALADLCRFRDCGHDTEPGCAIQAAIGEGQLDPARLQRWLKLAHEDVRNSETVAQMRQRGRKLEQTYHAGKAKGRSKRDDH
jgi:ribosome biogenesis GTPase / thiamine phosphate phosphatase